MAKYFYNGTMRVLKDKVFCTSHFGVFIIKLKFLVFFSTFVCSVLWEFLPYTYHKLLLILGSSGFWWISGTAQDSAHTMDIYWIKYFMGDSLSIHC